MYIRIATLRNYAGIFLKIIVFYDFFFGILIFCVPLHSHHESDGNKICGEICLLATTRKNAKIVKMVSRDLTVCFYSGSAYFEIVKNMWSYFLSTNEMMRTQNVNYPVTHHRLVNITTL